MFTNLNLSYQGNLGTSKGQSFFSRRTAASYFDRALSQGLVLKFWSKLTGRSSALQTLNRRSVAGTTSRSNRITFVPLGQIVGSESRVEDFDRCFNPMKIHHRDRWIGIAVARRSGVILPPVELIQVGDQYYVRDGHHRISVAKYMGQLEIEARIVN